MPRPCPPGSNKKACSFLCETSSIVTMAPPTHLIDENVKDKRTFGLKRTLYVLVLGVFSLAAPRLLASAPNRAR